MERFDIFYSNRVFESPWIVVLVLQDSLYLLHLFDRGDVPLEKGYQLRAYVLGHFLELMLMQENALPELLVWQVENHLFLLVSYAELVTTHHVLKWLLEFHRIIRTLFIGSYSEDNQGNGLLHDHPVVSEAHVNSWLICPVRTRKLPLLPTLIRVPLKVKINHLFTTTSLY